MNNQPMYRSERIRELREARALTQTQLAKLVGTTQATVSRIEHGEVEKRPDRPLAIKIARALSVSLSEVFDDAEPASAAAPDPAQQSGDLGLGLSAFEVAALSCVDPALHSIADLSVAAEAWRSATKASGRTADPGAVARLWLDAARALRVEGATVTPAAVIARVAMRETA